MMTITITIRMRVLPPPRRKKVEIGLMTDLGLSAVWGMVKMYATASLSCRRGQVPHDPTLRPDGLVRGY